MADDEDLYRAQRGRLFGIAYRMLGSAAEAEDIMQHASFASWTRGGQATRSRRRRAFLVTVTTRIGIDRLRSARCGASSIRASGCRSRSPRCRRTTRPRAPRRWTRSPWHSCSCSKRLGPVERAVFVLRDVFDHDYDEIGRIVDRSPAACRQIALRARRHVGEGRKRFAVDAAERDAVAERFARAWEGADLEGLLELLAPDISARRRRGRQGAAFRSRSGPCARRPGARRLCGVMHRPACGRARRC